MAKTDAKTTNVTTELARAKVRRTSADVPDKNDKKTKRAKKLTAEVSKAVRAALDKKAQDVVVLDLREAPAFTDFFILCSGNSQRQVKAIADAVEEALRAGNVRPSHVEGYDRGDWILMDFFTFIVHVFTPQTRSFYALERLWGDAERIDVNDDPASEKIPRA